MSSPVRNYKSNVPVKTLDVSGGIAAGTLQFNIDDTTGLPPVPFTMVIESDVTDKEEIITVTDVSGVQLTVLRGEDGTTATTHNDGVELRHMITARDLQNPRDHIDAVKNVHGISNVADNGVVGKKDSQILENKTLESPTLNGGFLNGVTLAGDIATTDASLSGGTIDATVLKKSGTDVSLVGHNHNDLYYTKSESNALLPVGTIAMWIAATIPNGWLKCDGTAIPSEYTALKALVGDNTPDLLGRVPIGAGTGTGLSTYTLGTKYGTEGTKLTAAHTLAHTHSDGTYTAASAGDHEHSVPTAASGVNDHDHAPSTVWSHAAAAPDQTYSSTRLIATDTSSVAHTHDVTGASGSFGTVVASQTPVPTLQPSLAVHFIIKAA